MFPISLGVAHDEEEDCRIVNFIMAPQSTPDWNDDLPNLLVFSKCSLRKLKNTAQETLEWIDL